MTSTATGATSGNTRTIMFHDREHKEFFLKYLQRCRWVDEYHQALIYCLGISEDTRKHIDRIYEFESGCVKPECLQEGWQTSGSTRIIRMAFCLYCNGTPSVDDMDTAEEQLSECGRYTAEELFCCSYAKYFWEAIKLRYPEYCN